MTNTRKFFDTLSQAFPLKPIRDDQHLDAAVKALDKIHRYLAKNPTQTEEILSYQRDLEKLIKEYQDQQPVH